MSEPTAMTITIHGIFDRTTEEMADIVDQALCDAGVCGCEGPGNGYSMSVDPDVLETEEGGRLEREAYIVCKAEDRNGTVSILEAAEADAAWIAEGLRLIPGMFNTVIVVKKPRRNRPA